MEGGGTWGNVFLIFGHFSTCTAAALAVHIFQILYARQVFRNFLSRAFTLCVHGRENKVTIERNR